MLGDGHVLAAKQMNSSSTFNVEMLDDGCRIEAFDAHGTGDVENVSYLRRNG
jgi:hypothetical protein